ncbi:MAG: hypothetical protein IPH48_18760 [bacterium]|nr:hypothetical protein [bacterium]
MAHPPARHRRSSARTRAGSQQLALERLPDGDRFGAQHGGVLRIRVLRGGGEFARPGAAGVDGGAQGLAEIGVASATGVADSSWAMAGAMGATARNSATSRRLVMAGRVPWTAPATVS